MQNQEIANALRDLEPEEASQIALNYLRSQNYVLKVWERDDIASILDQDPEHVNLTPEERERVLDLASEDSAFRNLEDATDSDWDAISQAVDFALRAVKG
ncbi:hypothetical protein QEH42_gp132 [Microbacterium phage Pumpernickel]|uniref:Uncharacterized protein n=1 Tax=Microbacterium phage Pumpernickel TaxID=2885983 RepID=A0AAE8Y8U4_9CAUD|nr:hypothetical protein QEH42_gp035 [Microbacterium phage Pumpernickel]YP_010755326.1 hypothetical protein QEH42_gp132 [Microbacterium phage Pumpernickel]UDL15826.1 hypothetical protein SEA_PUMPERNICKEL_35 [Microbacterium phage Pumpernickel]UDL16086.1 hypothetical protein SEA_PUMPERNICKEL_336 [Microbacterium phage Pumpernickel]